MIMGSTTRDIFGDATGAAPATAGTYGEPPPGYRLPESTRLGAVKLQVADVARSIHHELEAECRGARVWGPSARFEAQRVGREHVLADGDVVEIITRG